MALGAEGLAILYTLGPPSAERPRLLIRCEWRFDSITSEQVLQYLVQDGVDPSRVHSIRMFDPVLNGWALMSGAVVLSCCKRVEQLNSPGGVRVLELMIEELPIPPQLSHAFPSYSFPHSSCVIQSPPETQQPPFPMAIAPAQREPSLSQRASSESLETLTSTEPHPPQPGGGNTSFGSSFDAGPAAPSHEASGPTRRRRSELQRPSWGEQIGAGEMGRRESARPAVGDMQYQMPPHLMHSTSLHMPGTSVMPSDKLELALLHAAPLVWRRGNMQVPLDHQSLSLDFKGEVKALLDVLARVNKQIGVRFDVAASATLVEVLALKPVMLHLVCHGDVDENAVQASADDDVAPNADAFFLGFEDTEGALDQLSLERLRTLLNPPDLVRSTRLVFVSACHSQPAAEAFAAAGVPHVVAVRADAKVLDDAAALFARHLYLALVQGYSVRAAFELGKAALASAAPSIRLPKPSDEALKFLLLPQWGPAAASGADTDGVDCCPDPHDVVLFAALPPGSVVTRNPLPQHEPPYLTKPFLGRAIELQRLVLMLGRRRQKEVRLVTLCGPAGVGKTCLAIAAAIHLFERRWFPEGCVYVELRGRSSVQEALLALTEALDMELCSLNDIGRALKHWRGLLVLDGCDDAHASLMPTLLAKLLSTQDLRVLCTARAPLGVASERIFEVKPLQPLDAARLFRELAMEALPAELRPLQTLMEHPVLLALRGLPRAILQTAPLLRQGKTMADLEEDLRERDAPAVAPPPIKGGTPVPLLASTSTAASPAVSPGKLGSAPPASGGAKPNGTAESGATVAPTPVATRVASNDVDSLQKSLRRSLEVSLEFVKHTNEAAYALLGVMSLLPGGALASDLTALWGNGSLLETMHRLNGTDQATGSGSWRASGGDGGDVVVENGSVGTPEPWEPLMELLVQPPLGTEGQWLVRRRKLVHCGNSDHFVSELAQQQIGLPSMVLRELARRCALHFASMGEQAVRALEHGGDENAKWRELFADVLEANMCGCLSRERLKFLKCSSASAVKATANVGNSLSRILSLMGRWPEAAMAAEATITACHELDIAASESAAMALSLLGDQKLKLGEVSQAQSALQRAVDTWSASAFNAESRVHAMIGGVGDAAYPARLQRSHSSTAKRPAAVDECSVPSQMTTAASSPPFGRGRSSGALDSRGSSPLQRSPPTPIRPPAARSASIDVSSLAPRPSEIAAVVAKLDRNEWSLKQASADSSPPGIEGKMWQLRNSEGVTQTATPPAPRRERVRVRMSSSFDGHASKDPAQNGMRTASSSRAIDAADSRRVPSEARDACTAASSRLSAASPTSPPGSMGPVPAPGSAPGPASLRRESTSPAGANGERQAGLDSALMQLSSHAAQLDRDPSSRRWLVGLMHALLTLGDSHLAGARQQTRDCSCSAAEQERSDAAAVELLRAENHFREAQRRLPNDVRAELASTAVRAAADGDPSSCSHGGKSEGRSVPADDDYNEELARMMQHATAGLAEIALRRGEPRRAVKLLEEWVQADGAMLQLHGEALVKLGDLEEARAVLQKAVAKYRKEGKGVRAQEGLAVLEQVRVLLVSQQLDTTRLVVFHAAPLVVHQRVGEETRLQPVSFSKRVGIRAWRQLLNSLQTTGLGVKVQLQVATLAAVDEALRAEDRPMLHFLPAVEWGDGISLEGTAGELELLPVDALREMLEKHEPRRPSLVFICARRSDAVARAFVSAGVPIVVALRGFLPELSVHVFSQHFYDALLRGASPRAAYELARSRQQQEAPVAGAGEFVLVSSDGPPLPVLPPEGVLHNVSRKQCQCNLPFIGGDEFMMGESIGTLSTVKTPPDGKNGRGSERTTGSGIDSEDGGQLAHGTGFVGRHLEIHELIQSCLSNKLTSVIGSQGHGKSALVLEVARYLRERHRFPNGIFCCSLEGLRSMKQVVRTIGSTLNVPAGSARELCELMAHYRCCLLILERCEAAIQQSKPQFIWFLDQLLNKSCVKVLLLSTHPLTEFPPPDSNISVGSLTLGAMLPKDAALLLLELCEREIDAVEELGGSGEAGLLEALASHELIHRLGGVPVAVRWAARRLADKSVPELLNELRPLQPHEQARLVSQSSPAIELRPSRPSGPQSARTSAEPSSRSSALSHDSGGLAPRRGQHPRAEGVTMQRTQSEGSCASLNVCGCSPCGAYASSVSGAAGSAGTGSMGNPQIETSVAPLSFHRRSASHSDLASLSCQRRSASTVGGDNLSRVRQALQVLVESAAEVSEAAAAAAGQGGSDEVEGEITDVLTRLHGAFGPRHSQGSHHAHHAHHCSLDSGVSSAQHPVQFHRKHAGLAARDREVRDRERMLSRSRKMYALEQQGFVEDHAKFSTSSSLPYAED